MHSSCFSRGKIASGTSSPFSFTVLCFFFYFHLPFFFFRSELCHPLLSPWLLLPQGFRPEGEIPRRYSSSLRGRRLKGKGKGREREGKGSFVKGSFRRERRRGAREEGGRETSSLLPRAWSRVLIPFPFPFERLPRRLVLQ